MCRNIFAVQHTLTASITGMILSTCMHTKISKCCLSLNQKRDVLQVFWILTTFGSTSKPHVNNYNCLEYLFGGLCIALLKQFLASNLCIAGRRELALDHAKTFYELFNLTAKELVTSVVERGAVFRELDYMNALQLLHRSQPHPDPAKYFAKIHTALNYSFPFQVDCKHGEVE